MKAVFAAEEDGGKKKKSVFNRANDGSVKPFVNNIKDCFKIMCTKNKTKIIYTIF